jgi:hypothetical protein
MCEKKDQAKELKYDKQQGVSERLIDVVTRRPSETQLPMPRTGDEPSGNLKHANVHDSPGERVRCLVYSPCCQTCSVRAGSREA